MVDRWHLVLAAWSLGAGALVMTLDLVAPVAIRWHAVGLATLTGALLGGWGNERVWPWWLAAAAVVALPDRGRPGHPLGPGAPLLAVVGLVGVWMAVPDTEPPLAAACVLGPLAVRRLRSGPSVGPAGTAGLVVSVLGAVWVGSAGRGAALAAACAVGMVAVLPLSVGMGPDRLGRRRRSWVYAAHGAAVLVVPRSVMRLDVVAAWSLAATSLAVLWAVGRWASASVAVESSPGSVADDVVD
jgi:hypothetical protein